MCAGCEPEQKYTWQKSLKAPGAELRRAVELPVEIFTLTRDRSDQLVSLTLTECGAYACLGVKGLCLCYSSVDTSTALLH